MSSLMLSDQIAALARELHEEGDQEGAISEFECYCRRICTVDGSKDGLVSPTWGEPEWEWPKDPTLCEKSAAAILAGLSVAGWQLVRNTPASVQLDEIAARYERACAESNARIKALSEQLAKIKGIGPAVLEDR